MIPVARRMFVRNRAASAITVAVVAASVALQLFLFAVHEGVRRGATAYVRGAGVDIWVAQKNSDNILKSTSFLRSSAAEEIAAIPGVTAASPLIRLISKADLGGRLSSTLFVFGFDPATTLGAPREIVKGTAKLRNGEIVLDRSFAAKYRLDVGDEVSIHGQHFRVAGLSDGTNALVSQFAFVTRDDAETLLGLPGIASFVVVKTSGDRREVAPRIRAKEPGLAVYDAEDFIRFHDEELDNGVLPVFATAAGFGATVCLLLVALTLASGVLARREDYATLKAIGAGQPFLLRVVVGQALLATGIGTILGAAFAIGITPLLLRAVPALTVHYSTRLIAVLPACLLIGALAAAAPIVLLRRIEPEEVFRA